MTINIVFKYPFHNYTNSVSRGVSRLILTNVIIIVLFDIILLLVFLLVIKSTFVLQYLNVLILLFFDFILNMENKKKIKRDFSIIENIKMAIFVNVIFLNFSTKIKLF